MKLPVVSVRTATGKPCFGQLILVVHNGVRGELLFLKRSVCSIVMFTAAKAISCPARVPWANASEQARRQSWNC